MNISSSIPVSTIQSTLTEQSASVTSGQEIFHLSWNAMFHYYVHWRPLYIKVREKFLRWREG